MALRWVALTKIWHGQVVAYKPGDMVPDDNVAKWAYDEQGLVAQVEVDEDIALDPTNGTGVAFEKDVVLRSKLHIGPNPPEAPAVGTVWIDTSGSF